MLYTMKLKNNSDIRAVMKRISPVVLAMALFLPLSANASEGDNDDVPVVAVKSNLAAYVPVVPNIGIEVPFLKKFSFDIPVYYSPFTIAKNYNFRILAVQPELKYWFNNSMNGHYVGVHGMTGIFNVAVDGEDRYQSTDGDVPSWGVGIGYGYSLKLTENWALEFAVGVGYMSLDYDIFRNVDNGVLYDNKKISYWGPTKIGINIVYKFNNK